ncbi:DUF928 domain-containing protein [Microcoleus sp. FACHB-1515]|uniref:DUF928 domain-containing protein n=1 Tax=Cyanophyceae TaxID=3028117 RepID=UPI0028C48A6B|nr:DUF928 domain-containing protein [Microcoleus sp. FACHB-1515]
MTTTGRRGGCLSAETASLTAIAPLSHVGQTIAPHPTFMWFVPDEQPFSIEFYLYQQQVSGEQLIYQVNRSSTPGMMSLTLPTAEPALQVGQRYRWQVVLLCNPNSPSSALVADAEVEIARPSAELETAFASTINPAARANLLAEFGLWYDAIAVADPEEQINLLTNLSAIEAANGSSNHSQAIDRIIASFQSR